MSVPSKAGSSPVAGLPVRRLACACLMAAGVAVALLSLGLALAPAGDQGVALALLGDFPLAEAGIGFWLQWQAGVAAGAGALVRGFESLPFLALVIGACVAAMGLPVRHPRAVHNDSFGRHRAFQRARARRADELRYRTANFWLRIRCR